MKKALLTVAVVATAAIAGRNYQQNQNKVEMSDLALANVEALARYEDPNEGHGMKMENCERNGSVVGQRCVSAEYWRICNYNLQFGDCD